jgi:hypothetical protein
MSIAALVLILLLPFGVGFVLTGWRRNEDQGGSANLPA